MPRDDLSDYSPKESEKEKRREKKRRPKMQISGRSVVNLARIIAGRGQSKEEVKKSKKKRRRRKK